LPDAARAQGASQRIGAFIARAPAAALQVIFGEIGDLQEGGERVHEAHGVGDAQLAQLAGKKRGGFRRRLAVEADGGAADILDLMEDILAILLADDIAQHSAKHADNGALFFGVVEHRNPARARVDLSRDAYWHARLRDT
jgi:hypothetical protein